MRRDQNSEERGTRNISKDIFKNWFPEGFLKEHCCNLTDHKKVLNDDDDDDDDDDDNILKLSPLFDVKCLSMNVWILFLIFPLKEKLQ